MNRPGGYVNDTDVQTPPHFPPERAGSLPLPASLLAFRFVSRGPRYPLGRIHSCDAPPGPEVVLVVLFTQLVDSPSCLRRYGKGESPCSMRRTASMTSLFSSESCPTSSWVPKSNLFLPFIGAPGGHSPQTTSEGTAISTRKDCSQDTLAETRAARGAVRTFGTAGAVLIATSNSPSWSAGRECRKDFRITSDSRRQVLKS